MIESLIIRIARAHTDKDSYIFAALEEKYPSKF